MSRIGKNPVVVPANVTAQVSGQDISVEGPEGELSVSILTPITVELRNNKVAVNRPDNHRKSHSLHGLSRSLVNSMVVGVAEGYTIKMEIFGVSYRVAKKGKDLEFFLGYSHLILIEAPGGITFNVDSTTELSITGVDKQQVRQLATNIRRLRKNDPYKGEGIRYDGEQIRHKVGKTGK